MRVCNSQLPLLGNKSCTIMRVQSCSYWYNELSMAYPIVCTGNKNSRHAGLLVPGANIHMHQALDHHVRVNDVLTLHPPRVKLPHYLTSPGRIGPDVTLCSFPSLQ